MEKLQEAHFGGKKVNDLDRLEEREREQQMQSADTNMAAM